MTKFLNGVGNAITSRHLVLTALVALLFGLTPHVASFYYEALPHSSTGATVSSYFLAAATQLTLLLITVNYKLLSHAMKWNNIKLIVLITFVILLFYLKVFSETNLTLVFQKIFVAMIISGLEMIYTELFHIKWSYAPASEKKTSRQAKTQPEKSALERKQTSNGKSKLPGEVVSKILELGKSGNYSLRQIAAEVQTTHPTVSKILKDNEYEKAS